ncbi:MAG TPA: hypothetical protein EYQ86_05645 [Bacteroidetes bacterium]|nr:hypothetical protein [Bacteroidota bacterium]
MGVLIRILFVLTLCVSSCFIQVLLSNNIAFIANHGQWKRDVIAKAHIPNGVLIIKKNKWTFQLFDYSYFNLSVPMLIQFDFYPIVPNLNMLMGLVG